MTLTALYRRFFNPTLRALSGEAGPLRPGGWLGQRILVVPRAWCQFRSVPGDHRRERARRALRLKLQYEAQFSTPGYYLRPGARAASVWVWDQTRVEAAARNLGEDPERCRLVPESALVPPPETDTFTLLARQDGVEAQV